MDRAKDATAEEARSTLDRALSNWRDNDTLENGAGITFTTDLQDRISVMTFQIGTILPQPTPGEFLIHVGMGTTTRPRNGQTNSNVVSQTRQIGLHQRMFRVKAVDGGCWEISDAELL